MNKQILLILGAAGVVVYFMSRAKAADKEALDPWSAQNFVETAERHTNDGGGLFYFQPQFTNDFDAGVYQEIIGGN